jgi:hypothetical protein
MQHPLACSRPLQISSVYDLETPTAGQCTAAGKKWHTCMGMDTLLTWSTSAAWCVPTW